MPRSSSYDRMQSSKENNNNSPKIAIDKTNETKNLSSVGHWFIGLPVIDTAATRLYQQRKRMSLLCGSRDEPLQDSVEICLFLGAYAIARDFTMGHALQIQRIDQLVHSEMAAEIRFVAQDQERDSLHGWLF
jgi:hypothetical protein